MPHAPYFELLSVFNSKTAEPRKVETDAATGKQSSGNPSDALDGLLLLPEPCGNSQPNPTPTPEEEEGEYEALMTNLPHAPEPPPLSELTPKGISRGHASYAALTYVKGTQTALGF
jgi:hypothetical protein